MPHGRSRRTLMTKYCHKWLLSITVLKTLSSKTCVDKCTSGRGNLFKNNSQRHTWLVTSWHVTSLGEFSSWQNAIDVGTLSDLPLWIQQICFQIPNLFQISCSCSNELSGSLLEELLYLLLIILRRFKIYTSLHHWIISEY